MFKHLVIAMSLVLVMGACGSGEEGSGGADDTSGSSSSEAGSFGEAASAGDADRTVEVSALDKLAFDPASVEVKAGETINFVVTNDGKAPHEFVIGDRDYQEEHEKSMGSMGSMDHGGEDLGNVLELEPGATEEIAWTFTEAGEVLFACHVEGHYEGGMVGSVKVQ